MKTAKLRKTIKTILNPIVTTFAGSADEDAEFPFAVFNMYSTNLSDLHRDDIDLEISIWDRSADPKRIDNIADSIDSALNAANIPNDGIYPTFFRDTRVPVRDPDPCIQHIEMHFTIQNYEG